MRSPTLLTFWAISSVTGLFAPAMALAQSSAVTPEAPWGEPVNGVQIRLRQATPGKVPLRKDLWIQLEMDIRNHGTSTFVYKTGKYFYHAEFDGVWYECRAGYNGGYSSVDVGRESDDRMAMSLDGSFWYDAKNKLLSLTPGKHTVRYGIEILHQPVSMTPTSAPHAAAPMVVSNPIEIEIVDTAAPAQANSALPSGTPPSFFKVSVGMYAGAADIYERIPPHHATGAHRGNPEPGTSGVVSLVNSGEAISVIQGRVPNGNYDSGQLPSVFVFRLTAKTEGAGVRYTIEAASAHAMDTQAVGKPLMATVGSHGAAVPYYQIKTPIDAEVLKHLKITHYSTSGYVDLNCPVILELNSGISREGELNKSLMVFSFSPVSSGPRNGLPKVITDQINAFKGLFATPSAETSATSNVIPASSVPVKAETTSSPGES